VQVATSVVHVAGGDSHSQFVKLDGTLWAMGDNSFGQLGDGTTTNRTTPVQVGTNVSQVAAGQSHSLFIKTDGSAWGMGTNGFGELGDGSTTRQKTPVQVAAGVTAIAAGSRHSLFLQSEGIGAVPVISLAPQSQAFEPGLPRQFSVVAFGSGPLGYQWRRNGVAITGARNATYYRPVTFAGDLGAEFDVVVANSADSVISQPAKLLLPVAPLVTQQPASEAVVEGTSVTLTAGIDAVPAATYQWYRNGTAIAGATGSTLSLGNVTPAEAGQYTVTATNSLGTVISEAAQISVSYSRIGALSVRSLVGAGDNTLIAGLVMNGSVNKRVVFRGVESTVRTAGVTGTVRDPSLSLFNTSGVLLRSNTDWGNDPELAAIFPTLGLAPLPTSSLDAAMLPQITPGVYTAHVSGAPGDTGVGLLEMYDADATIYGSRLSAISVRSFSGPGADVLIVGVVITGNTPARVVVRAVGPSLGNAVPTRMADPILTLYRVGVAASIGSNDNWGGSSEMVANFATVGLAALPADSKDAAMALTLDPGVYTVHAGGVGGSGVVLMEMYELP
jgi:hypothetical protein